MVTDLGLCAEVDGLLAAALRATRATLHRLLRLRNGDLRLQVRNDVSGLGVAWGAQRNGLRSEGAGHAVDAAVRKCALPV